MQFTPRATQINGTLVTPTCSKAPGTTSTAFQFYAKRGTGQGLMVFFGGGGACWNSESCGRPHLSSMPDAAPALYRAEIFRDDPATYAGVLDSSDPSNPMRTWSMVYIPNCTGDLHSGSKTTTYVDPATRQPFSIEHRGADNVNVVMEWIKENFGSPDDLMVTGSSAGGLGAIIHYPQIRRAYPRARSFLLADSAPTVMPAVFETTYRQNWNMQIDRQVYGNNAQGTPVKDLLQKLTASYAGDRFGQYTTAIDMTLISYYDAMANGIDTGIQGSACSAWVDDMLAGLASNQVAANYRSYMGAGMSHTLLAGTNRDGAGVPLFNREISGGGVRFTDWLGGQLSANGAGWSNAACSDCTTVSSCPY